MGLRTVRMSAQLLAQMMKGKILPSDSNVPDDMEILMTIGSRPDEALGMMTFLCRSSIWAEPAEGVLASPFDVVLMDKEAPNDAPRD